MKSKYKYPYPYIFETYEIGKTNKHKCPLCGEFTFVRYIYTDTEDHIGNEVGKCDRISRCGYWHKPGEFFKKNPAKRRNLNSSINNVWMNELKTEKNENYDVINKLDFEDKLEVIECTNFYEYLLNNNLFKKFKFCPFRSVTQGFIHNSQVWTLFWQRDSLNHNRTGKLIQFNSNGRRKKMKINWIHSLINNYSLEQCFFGAHQFFQKPKYWKSTYEVGIVESETTAILASIKKPEIIWLAAGQKNGLNIQKFLELPKYGHLNIILYPDTSINNETYDYWKEKAEEISFETKLNITCSDFLEKECNHNEKEAGYDLRDYWEFKQSSSLE